MDLTNHNLVFFLRVTPGVVSKVLAQALKYCLEKHLAFLDDLESVFLKILPQ